MSITPITNQNDPFNAVVWWNSVGELKYDLSPVMLTKPLLCIDRTEKGRLTKHYFTRVGIDSNGVHSYEEVDEVCNDG